MDVCLKFRQMQLFGWHEHPEAEVNFGLLPSQRNAEASDKTTLKEEYSR